MKLHDAAANYVAHKQSMGMRFRTEARTLKSFCHAVGDVTMQDVSIDKMAAFLAGTGPITRFWERKHSVLRGFYRFVIARGYVDHSPLPRNVPRPLQAFEPYIYSREELHRLLDAVIANDHPRNHIDPETYRVLLLLLYGAGLRIVKRSRLPWPMSISPPAFWSFARANSTRLGWCRSAAIWPGC